MLRFTANRRLVGRILAGCVVIVSLAFAARSYFGSWAGFAAYLRGQSVHVSPQRVELGERQAGTNVDLSISVRNLTRKELSIVGQRSTCLCLVAKPMPIMLPSRASVAIPVQLRLASSVEQYQQGIVFMVAERDRLSMHPVAIQAIVRDSSTVSGDEIIGTDR